MTKQEKLFLLKVLDDMSEHIAGTRSNLETGIIRAIAMIENDIDYPEEDYHRQMELDFGDEDTSL